MAPIGSFIGKLLEKLEQAAQPKVSEVHLERLEEALKLPLPRGLAVPPPRPDVWLGRGYLAQYRYATLYKPLLIHGRVTRGIIYQYESSADPDGCDTTARYAWFERPGQLRDARLRESYDGLHAAYGRDKALDTCCCWRSRPRGSRGPPLRAAEASDPLACLPGTPKVRGKIRTDRFVQFGPRIHFPFGITGRRGHGRAR